MARWDRERIRQRVEDLKLRLSQGQTLATIAQAWGTSKQNVSQFRKRYVDEGRPGRSPRPETNAKPQNTSSPEDQSLYLKAYHMILARDWLISDLEGQIRELKYRLFDLQRAGARPSDAKQTLKDYISEHEQG
ncbi:MAG TPA: hypothetical protein G4O03_05520 [Dehalococcoidia bacterium]|jgi:transposase-like protein|nr:hypothetical protein [Dehalococcoidia bacterium]